MRRLDSVIIKAAEYTQVPAGGALAVDREGFSDFVTREVSNHPLVEVMMRQLQSLMLIR